MKKKRTKLLVFFALAGILVLFYMIGESYCEGLSGGSSLEEKKDRKSTRLNSSHIL